jgi:cytochrome c oxidase cbb3-type subunit 2
VRRNFFKHFLLLLLYSAFLAHASVKEGDSINPGRILYDTHCAICHGVNGNGQGAAAPLFQTRPRDFTKGEYKIKSTPSGSLPTDDDLARSIKFGLPGTAMLPQTVLTDDEIRAVVTYIKTFSPKFARAQPDKPIPLPSAPPPSPERMAEGKAAYQKAQCHQCHGLEGKGDGILAKDLAIKPADLTRRPLKSGPTPSDIARTILTGFDGTSMPPYQFVLEEQDLWNIAYYIHSLGGPPQQTDDEKKGLEIMRTITVSNQKNKEK